MLSIMRQGAIYLYKLNFMVDLIIGNEQIRDYINIYSLTYRIVYIYMKIIYNTLYI